MNEMTLSSLIQIMQDGFIQHDKQESAGRFLLESVTIQEDSLCTTDLNSKKISRLVSKRSCPRRHKASRVKKRYCC